MMLDTRKWSIALSLIVLYAWVYHNYTHHISFLCEDGIVETFQGHPFVGDLRIGSVVLSEVAASIDVLSQTKVPHPDTPSRVQPILLC